MRLDKSLNLTTLKEYIQWALVDLSTLHYIQLFPKIIISSGELFKAFKFVQLKIQCDFWLK